MKSLDKLRSMELSYYHEDEEGHCEYRLANMDEIADEIEDELMDCWMPWPLYEDGEPICFGDVVVVDADDPRWRTTMIVDSMTYMDDCYIMLRGTDKPDGETVEAEIEWGERLLRPPKEVDE